MATIKNKINIIGTALMSGKDVNVSISPSEQKGVRVHLKNSYVELSVDNVISTQNCTVIGNKEVQIALVEHLSAACAFTGIDSLDVFVDSNELPIFDGSSKKWVELLETAGVNEISLEPFEIQEPVCYQSDRTSIVVLPSDSFKVTYMVNYNHPDLGNKWYNWEFTSESKQYVIEARTFGYLKDLEKFQKMGLSLGVTIDNTVGLKDEGYTTPLRSELEPIKHKILDLIGDLNLLSINPLVLKGHIIVKEGGHAGHVAFAKVLKQALNL